MERDAKTYGYVRVSSKDQNEARQLLALAENGVKKENIFMDKQSGKDFERPAYKKLLKKMRPGDALVIQSIDRLGRNYAEILEHWRILTKARGLHIRVIDMPLLDTTNAKGDLMGTFIADLVLQILSFVAENERGDIRKRQAEGINAAQQRGVKFGRPTVTVPDLFFELKEQYQIGEMVSREAGRLLGISHTQFLKWCRMY